MDQLEKKLEVATEAVKQQITLASAIIGAVLAFSNSLKDARQGRIWSLLPWAILPLGLTVIFGVLALMSIAYYLKYTKDPFEKGGVRLLGVAQNVCFLVAVMAMVFIIASS